MVFICINNGFYNTKVKYGDKTLIFKSAVRKPIFDHETAININGTDYVVGEGNQDADINKTTSVTQQACIINAINHFKLQEINVVTALPTSSYINHNTRSSYKSMVESLPGVKDCTVYMEGVAAMLADYEWYKGKLVCLLDIGGLTINSMLFDDTRLVAGSAFSMQLGTMMLESRIKHELERSIQCHVPEYQIKYMLDTDEAIEVTTGYIKEIKQELKRANYPGIVEYRLTGGGAITYGPIIGKAFNNAYVGKNAIWENVLGLERVGLSIYSDK